MLCKRRVVVYVVVILLYYIISMGIKVCVAQDRCAWRNAIRGPTRASADALHLTLVV